MARTPWLMSVMAMVLGCGPKSAGETDGGETSSEASSDASGGEAPTTGGAPDLPPVDPCGNGELDPGEECDDGNGGCDACSEVCTVPVDPALEWSVALDPIVAVLGFDLTQQGRAYVLGEAIEGGPLLLQIEATGVVGSVDLTALGFAEVVAFHVNGAAIDGVEVGVLARLVDDSLSLARISGDGLVVDPIPIDEAQASATMAITSIGVTFADIRRDAWTLTWTGEVLATFENTGTYDVDAVGDRLVFGGDPVVLVDADGADRVELACPGRVLATSGTHVVGFGSAGAGHEEATMSSCELATGEYTMGVVAMGAGGLEAGPFADSVDAGPSGHPIGPWSACPGSGSVMGCEVPRTRGFGGPDDPHALELDGCDLPETAHVGLDRGVYMIRRDRTTGALSLVRRGTLPDAPPWSPA